MLRVRINLPNLKHLNPQAINCEAAPFMNEHRAIYDQKVKLSSCMARDFGYCSLYMKIRLVSV